MLLSYEDKARIERVLSITGSKTKYVKQVESCSKFQQGKLNTAGKVLFSTGSESYTES